MRLTQILGICFSLTFAGSSALFAQGEPPAAQMKVGGLVEYRTGNTPVIIVSGHDGSQRPDDIADRKTGIRANDRGTRGITRKLYDTFHRETGAYPHLVYCDLARVKVDVNRDLPEAQEGDIGATEAWRAYHSLIDEAARQAIAEHGFAFLVDIHRHPHPEVRLELGQAITREELNLSDEELDRMDLADKSALTVALARYDGPFSKLLRGEDSIGAIYNRHGLRAIPSPQEPQPLQNRFFSGGYTTRHHTGKKKVDGVQIEISRVNLDDPGYHKPFCDTTVAVLREFLGKRYGYELPGGSASTNAARK